MRKIALFSGKIYTAGTNFTRPPVVTVATKFLCNMQYAICSDVIKDGDNERGTGGRRKISNKAHIGSHTKVTAHRDEKMS